MSAIYFLGFRARPGRHLPEAKEVGGAYVNCWIKAVTEQEAQKTASDFIAAEGWIIEAVEHECHVIDEPNDHTRERFKQAQIDGSCYQFHEWPIDNHAEEPLH